MPIQPVPICEINVQPTVLVVIEKSQSAALASMMERLWSTPPHTFGIFNPACCATSTNCTGDAPGFEVAALTSAGSLHCQSGVVRASISVLPNRKKDEPRKRRRGRFMRCDHRGRDWLQTSSQFEVQIKELHSAFPGPVRHLGSGAGRVTDLAKLPSLFLYHSATRRVGPG